MISQERLKLATRACAVCVVYAMQPLPNYYYILLVICNLLFLSDRYKLQIFLKASTEPLINGSGVVALYRPTLLLEHSVRSLHITNYRFSVLNGDTIKVQMFWYINFI